MYYKCYKINSKHGGSYIDSRDWIKNKTATIYHINKKDNKYFQYAVAVTLNYEEIKKDSQRITQFKPFIKKYNWDKVNFSSEKDDWERFEKNNVTISLKVLYAKKDLIMFQNITQIVKKSYFFNDSSGKGWHYLIVKNYQHY